MMTSMGLPSLSCFGGSYASDELMNDLRRTGDPLNFFGSERDLLGESIDRIRETIVSPIQQVENRIRRHFYAYQTEDYDITALIENEDYEVVPEFFHMPILQHAPVRKLFERGMIHGFGYDEIPEGDPYQRLIDNGKVEIDDPSQYDDEGYVTFTSTHRCDDPDLSFAEIDAIELTRGYIDWLLENTDYDPTDSLEHRG